MAIIRLDISQFRNLQPLRLMPNARLNLLVGENGSGKSSVLEAIHLLAMGRSFRTHLVGRFIQHQANDCTLFAKLLLNQQPVAIGVHKTRDGEHQLRMDGNDKVKLADIASLLPVQLIHPEGHSLVTGAPSERRAWLDWLVFHLEPSFYQHWQQYKRALKQRNTLLRQQAAPALVRAWDQPLVHDALAITALRERVYQRFLPLLQPAISQFLPEVALELQFYQGWDQQRDLYEVMQTQLNRDYALGYTQFGAHKADVRLSVEGLPAADVLSRGQSKLLLCALRLAQGLALQQFLQRHCVYLIDDFASELDEGRRSLLADYLSQMQAQVFITAIHQAQLRAFNQDAQQLFHVEQGQVLPI